MIAVGTPAFPDGRCNLTYVWQAVDELAQTLTHPATVIVKSTVPPGTTAQIQRAMRKRAAFAPSTSWPIPNFCVKVPRRGHPEA